MTSLALSTADQDAITRTIDVRQEEVGETSLDVLYEVDWTVAVIQRRNHRRVRFRHNNGSNFSLIRIADRPPIPRRAAPHLCSLVPLPQG